MFSAPIFKLYILICEVFKCLTQKSIGFFFPPRGICPFLFPFFTQLMLILSSLPLEKSSLISLTKLIPFNIISYTTMYFFLLLQLQFYIYSQIFNDFLSNLLYAPRKYRLSYLLLFIFMPQNLENSRYSINIKLIDKLMYKNHFFLIRDISLLNFL